MLGRATSFSHRLLGQEPEAPAPRPCHSSVDRSTRTANNQHTGNGIDLARGQATPPPIIGAPLGERGSLPAMDPPAPVHPTLAHRQLGGEPLAGQLRSKLFLCPDHKTLRITERIARLLCPSSEPGPRHPPQQVSSLPDDSFDRDFIGGLVGPSLTQPRV